MVIRTIEDVEKELMSENIDLNEFSEEKFRELTQLSDTDFKLYVISEKKKRLLALRETLESMK